MTPGTAARALPELTDPGRGRGLAELVRRRYLLRLLVRRELRARYQESVLGLGWSYVRPAVAFSVYFLVVGVVLRMNRNMEDFAVFLFSGMVLVNFFTDTLHSATRAVRGNAPLIRKIYLPREMFPVASGLVSAVHFIPGLIILSCGAVVTGWRPSFTAVGAALLGFAIVAVLGMALGLLCAAYNVFYRDFEQVVDVLNIVFTWSVPMIYPWTLVRDTMPGWVLDLYLANPLAIAVSLFQRCFWFPGTDGTFDFPPALARDGLIALAVAVILLAVTARVFNHKQKRFAEEL
ncbi:ABC transporter permease [Actinomadura sp. LOL_011]|uniref:ABC transporter permease n=1 Tax=Actinomadura sp. LOL_011 TaxID=3345410 RepID=UPI003A804D6B